MDDTMIRVRDLGKRYRIGNFEPYKTLRQSISRTLSRVANGRVLSKADETASELWALKHVSFDVKKGEVLGIIGRNGAGKSTLLKVLSRITDPTRGEVSLSGRVGSLLEVGTGFHPELTGRENIFLNGAIIGMSKKEIRSKFEEIVAFAEVEKFIDTPVKRYSSGMYTRLAFSVAAHLEPEILIIDEVLAVGDMEFQQKCIGRMDDMARRGRTVLFVSHNLPVVQKLCSRAIVLRNGDSVFDGSAAEAASVYLRAGGSDHLTFGAPVNLMPSPDMRGSGEATITRVTMFDPSGAAAVGDTFKGGDIGFSFEISGAVGAVKAVGLHINDESGRKLVNFNTMEKGSYIHLRGSPVVELLIRDVRLRPGQYSLGFWLGAGEERHIFILSGHQILDVLPAPGSTWHSKHDGIFACPFDFRIKDVGASARTESISTSGPS